MYVCNVCMYVSHVLYDTESAVSLSARADFMTPVTVETKRFSSTRSSIVKMTARWEKGYIQMVWWINKHERSISNGVLCVIALPLSGTFNGHKIGMGFFGGFAGSPKDFFGSWPLAPFDHPRHLKSRVPPWGGGGHLKDRTASEGRGGLLNFQVSISSFPLLVVLNELSLLKKIM